MNMKIPTWLTSHSVNDDVQAIPLLAKPLDSELKPVYIYMLVDPETMEPRYIGKSIRPHERLTNHMNDRSECHRTHWLQALKRKGLMPIQVIIEEILGAWPWQESERFWIRYMLSHGFPLVNNTDGGDGVSGVSGEAKTRMLNTWKGRKHTEETKRKISEYRKTWNPNAETRAAMSRAHTGRKFTPEWLEKISIANRKLSPVQQVEILNRLRRGELGKSLAAEFGVHRITITKVKMGKYVRGH